MAQSAFLMDSHDATIVCSPPLTSIVFEVVSSTDLPSNVALVPFGIVTSPDVPEGVDTVIVTLLCDATHFAAKVPRGVSKLPSAADSPLRWGANAHVWPIGEATCSPRT